MTSVTRRTLVGRLVALSLTASTLAWVASATVESDAAPLCFTGSSRQNATGHWIITATITNKNGRLHAESAKDHPTWTYDLEFRRLVLNKRPALETKLLVSVPSTAVRSDYTHYDGIGYYKFHNTPVTWPKAKVLCEEEGAHLAIINSKKEEEAIKNILKQNVKGDVNVFIGIHDLYEEGEYETVLGEPLSSIGYVNWAKGQPNNYAPGQDCGSYFYDGGLNDWHCDGKFTFLCELPQ